MCCTKMCGKVLVLWEEVGKRKKCSSTSLTNRDRGQVKRGDINPLFFPAGYLAVRTKHMRKKKTVLLDLI